MQTQPSSAEIQHEFAALRDIRRRTSEHHTAGNTIDPDLPPDQTQHQRESAIYSAFETPVFNEAYREASLNEDVVLSGSTPSHDTDGSRAGHTARDSPLHLFWVPARLHPEIDPTEFRAFLKEHAKNPPADGDEGSALSRASSTGLTRRASSLRKQFNPSTDRSDDAPEGTTRNSSLRRHPGPKLTIADLQRLDELAEQTAASSSPMQLRGLLKRSLSLGVPPAELSLDAPQADSENDGADDPNAPIIVPPPGQILRRTARTKIRKPGLPGDGNGHRFQPSKRGQSKAASQSEDIPPVPALPPSQTSPRSSSFSHGTSAWTDRTSLSSEPETATTSETDHKSGDSHQDEERSSLTEESDIHDTIAPSSAPVPIIYHSAPPAPAITPTLPTMPAFEVQRGEARPMSPYLTSNPPKSAPASRRSPSPTPIPQPISPSKSTKEREKKGGLFSKWGSDKAPKRSKTMPSQETSYDAHPAKEKETGFFGSLFSKKKNDANDHSAAYGGPGSASRTSPLQPSANKFVDTSDGYSRYPLHIERAIYRLSHIKLANPRRPLYEQVLISNLMFWYLGVINASNKKEENSKIDDNRDEQERLRLEQEQKEKEEQERERERQEREWEEQEQERERQEREQREREERERNERQSRRKPLTKSASMGARNAERPIKAPTYSMQAQEMDQQAFERDWAMEAQRREYHSSSRHAAAPQYYLPPVNPSGSLSDSSLNLDLDWFSSSDTNGTSHNPASSSSSPPPVISEKASKAKRSSPSPASPAVTPNRATSPHQRPERQPPPPQFVQPNGHMQPSHRIRRTSPPPRARTRVQETAPSGTGEDKWRR